jgi:DNA-directed RNA polymerase-3 subunit RPC5
MSFPIKSEFFDDDEVQVIPSAMELDDDDDDDDEMMGDENKGGDDDEIVREIDVYLSPDLASQIYLLQYPLQHAKTVTSQPVQVRIKPRHGMIELDQPITANNTVIGTEGAYPHMKERTFQSQIIPIQTHMCLGRLETLPGDSNNSNSNSKPVMHLIPLQHISQLRPSFSHITKVGDESNAADEDDDYVDDETKKDAAAAAASKKKPLVFQRKESERAAMVRKSSYAYKKASEDSEEWQELAVRNVNSIAFEKILERAKCPCPNDSIWGEIKKKAHETVADDPNVEYVQSLNYLPPENDEAKLPTIPGQELATAVARLTALMAPGWPIPFSILRPHFPDLDESDLLTALSVSAVMVRGNFCLHSKYLAVPKALKGARTFMLYLLQTEGSLQRSRLDAVYKDEPRVKSEQLLALLEQLCQRATRGWTLKIEDDMVFVVRQQEQAALHQQYWDRQGMRFRSELTRYRR